MATALVWKCHIVYNDWMEREVNGGMTRLAAGKFFTAVVSICSVYMNVSIQESFVMYFLAKQEYWNNPKYFGITY